MQIETIKFKSHRCFIDHWTGFDQIKPINVIIGRNNSGKSHLLDFVRMLCGANLDAGTEYRCSGRLEESELKTLFNPHHEGGRLPGNHWRDHGRYFVNKEIEWTVKGKQCQDIVLTEKNLETIGLQPHIVTMAVAERLATFERLFRNVIAPLGGRYIRKLSAERNVVPEAAQKLLALRTTGEGATNIVARYLTSAQLQRELIQNELLDALNAIFGNDGIFSEIVIKQHDAEKLGVPDDQWEIFLGQPGKRLIPLSDSGSGLKTILLVLLNLLVIPQMEKHDKGEYVFCFEELENNLHPALLRRLFQFIEKFADKHKCSFFLTTHSSTALDFFGLSPHAQIIHVTHNGKSARAITVAAHLDKLGVISELGAKPSDLLQANGIIWVEGPSDCIYLNRWIYLYSNGELQEGRDYQCAFYGGALLARTQFTTPEAADVNLANLFRINPNIIVVADSDKQFASSEPKARVVRIQAEIAGLPNAHMWITAAKEIENYNPGDAFAKATKDLFPEDPPITTTDSPKQFESFFPGGRTQKSSYWLRKTKRKSFDKTELAIAIAQHMTLAILKDRFDLDVKMIEIVKRIRSWNS